jgi:NAD(P)-dependent dehydrogenase (short-subunit alcohol dehydrogenase family)
MSTQDPGTLQSEAEPVGVTEGVSTNTEGASTGIEAGSGPFAGLAAIVTGGASGIGLSTALLLSAQGARVAVFDLDRALGTDLLAPLVGVPVDVTDDESVAAGVARVVDAFGGIDILVNNAGIGAQGTVADNPMSEWQKVFDVNVFGVVRVTRAAIPYLRRSPSAAVVNTCSVAATAGIPNRALYSATKGAVLSLTQAMAADHIREGIRVNCVNPGTADTPWVERLLAAAPDPAAERAALEARQPHGRLVRATEVAAAIAYLAAPTSGSTTGTTLTVDGGMQALRLRPVES